MVNWGRYLKEQKKVLHHDWTHFMVSNVSVIVCQYIGRFLWSFEAIIVDYMDVDGSLFMKGEN